MGSNRRQHGDDNLSEWGRSARQEERGSKKHRFERESIEDSIQSNDAVLGSETLADPDLFLGHLTQEQRRLRARKRRRDAATPRKHEHQYKQVSEYPAAGIRVRVLKCTVCKRTKRLYDWSRE